MEHHDHPAPELMIKQYLKIAYTLFGLTLLTVVASWNWVPQSWGEIGTSVHIGVGLLIAFVKAAMVVYIFMHIKFDNKFLRAFIFVPLFLLAVLSFALNVLGP
ncbi:MAG: cytochrome C oxidase subunit IV family protein [Ignavibacteria bacterium]|nr:cytochrome C oxidase subunit IV family protein [Ignavibacteria bacterium]